MCYNAIHEPTRNGSDLKDSFMSHFRNDDTQTSLSLDSLADSQKTDGTLKALFLKAVNEEESADLPVCYYIGSHGVLMRKWRDANVSADPWNEVHQIIVPEPYRRGILEMAHDAPMGGHLGVRKTLRKIRRYFFWPSLQSDVVQFCRSCHLCQVVGKPNVKIPPAPLKPIPAVGEPFSRVIIDCVGPLPRTKSGYEYLLTIMDPVTRFPEAIPLRAITAKAVVTALIKFFTTFGLPKTVQSDQGSNFTSKLFQQAMVQLGIKHEMSSAYHPQSQGAIERFHQTLKNMVKIYCMENGKDWDVGLPFLMFAIRESEQESLGFAPFDLVFGHSVRGPLQWLYERMLNGNDDKKENLLTYVSCFREKLFDARKMAAGNLSKAQEKMKCRFDSVKGAVKRSFKVGDRVLALLPIPGSLQARYSGPYAIHEKVSDLDYVVATPDRKKPYQLCHINLLKLYVDRSAKKVVESSICLTAEEVEDDVKSPLDDYQKQLRNSIEDEDRWNHLSLEKRKSLIDLINEFSILFPDVPSRTNVISHDVDVGSSPPIKQHPYRVNPIRREAVSKAIAYMLEHDIIRPSQSSWSSPCLLVPKKDQSFRLCTDYRKVNSVTKSDSFPIPRMDDCIDEIGSAVFVTTLDLLKGYYQVPLTPRAREISAFATSDGLYEYQVMPFGMKNAPATFQRMMTTVTQGIRNCRVYIDDIVLFHNEWDEHIRAMRVLFEKLTEANLTVNLSKCEFAKGSVVYLGHVVGNGKIKPVQAKVEAIEQFPVPKSKQELSRFLGLAGYYRKFCKNFASVVAPLTDLLGSVQFQWTQSCTEAFCRVKTMLTTEPILASPDYGAKFYLTIDACDVGVGAVLQQRGHDGTLRPISYFSRKLNSAQRKYSTVEKEALALILAVRHYEVYLSIGHTIVFSDHNPLTFLHRMKGNNARIMRWSLSLSEFDLEIQHIRGKDNVVADALSRCN